MNKKKEQKLVCLTEQCLKRYWEKDCEVMLSYCTDDILWTGAEQKEYIMGIEAVRKNFTELMNYSALYYLEWRVYSCSEYRKCMHS